MNLDDLNQSVTASIFRAEAEKPRSWEQQRAYREVADLEEEMLPMSHSSL